MTDTFYTETWPDYVTTQRKDLFWYRRLWAVLLEQLELRIPEKEKRHLLDFGSGPGFLLQQATERGWCCEGLEPSAVARYHARQVWIHSSAIPKGPLGRFTAVISTETLEHIDDVDAALQSMHAWLGPQGYLALSVPNDENPLQRLFWPWKKPWRHHTHKHYFNPDSLKRKVEANGFVVEWERTSFPVELFLILPIPRKWAWKLSRVWPAPPFLWRLRIGRHCLLVARKR